MFPLLLVQRSMREVPTSRMLTAAVLQKAFTELGTLAEREGKVIDLAVYGGSALMLASNFRVATEDVDAVAAGDQSIVRHLAEEVARRCNFPPDWLNDGVRTYLSPNVDGILEHHSLFRAYPSEQRPGLRVFVPSPEYMLAMKLMAMRLDPSAGKSDLADIMNLLPIVGLRTPEEIIDFVATFYPEAKISARLQLGIRALWRDKDTYVEKSQHEPPRYLGQTRAPP